MSAYEVEFTFKVNKEDKNPQTVKCSLDFDDLSGEEILELASSTVIINQLQTKLRSGTLKVEDIDGGVWKVRKPGTRTRDDSEKVAEFMAKYEELTGNAIDEATARGLMKVLSAKKAK